MTLPLRTGLRDLSLIGNTRLNRQLNHRAFYEEPTDPTPPAETTYTAEDFQALQAQVEALTQDKTKLTGVIENLRKSEKGYKTVKAILGDTDPEKLQEYVTAEERARTAQEKTEQQVLLARQEVEAEWKTKLDESSSQVSKLQQQIVNSKIEQDLLRAYTQNGGIYQDFGTFHLLAQGNVSYNQKGAVEIRDDVGELLIFRPADPKETERQASLGDFMTMVADGQIDKYQFRHSTGMKRCMEAYNKSSGANLPGSNGTGGKDGWKNLEGDALWQAAFQ